MQKGYFFFAFHLFVYYLIPSDYHGVYNVQRSAYGKGYRHNQSVIEFFDEKREQRSDEYRTRSADHPRYGRHSAVIVYIYNEIGKFITYNVVYAEREIRDHTSYQNYRIHGVFATYRKQKDDERRDKHRRIH